MTLKGTHSDLMLLTVTTHLVFFLYAALESMAHSLLVETMHSLCHCPKYTLVKLPAGFHYGAMRCIITSSAPPPQIPAILLLLKLISILW